MGKLISKADIFKRGKTKIDTVHVEDWGGDVTFKAMTMAERREIRKKSSQVITGPDGESATDVDNEKFEIYALIYCALAPDDDGSGTKMMFDTEDFASIENQLAAGPLSIVSQAILKASGLAGSDAVKSSKKGAEEGQ